MSKHNKKRNVGIIYEQLLLSLSGALVEGNTNQAKIIKGLIDKHFKPGTQLYREFRLFQALVKTRVPRETLAIKILNEAKEASRDLDEQKLQIEKSLLIKDINYKISENSFYAQRVSEYRDFASVQTLLNLWRKGKDSSLKQIAEYESKIQDLLLREESIPVLEDQKTPEVNRFTVKIMLEKFNKKYKEALNPDQTSVIKEYIFSSGENQKLSFVLKNIKDKALKEINKLPETHSNKILCEKMEKVKKQVSVLDENIHDDENISRFLLLSKLHSELKEESK